jgi:alkylation response protein AidB-like acyl-CoA dehydrogenase
MQTPGITARPIIDLAGDDYFSEVHFDDVALPEDALLGTEGSGWEQVTAALAIERSGPERIYSSMTLIQDWITYLRRRGSNTDKERETVGRMVAQCAALRNMSLAVTARLAAGESPMVEASIVKDLGTTFEQSIPNLIIDHLGDEKPGSLPPELMATLDYVAAISPCFSLRGGTREILRGIIARGLKLR